MRFYSYLKSTVQILDEYKGDKPFAVFLKKYFSQLKKYGSKDRKQIGHLCYCYFRLGKSLLKVPVEERILAALFLCAKEPNEILEELKPEWNKNAGKSFGEKCSMLNGQCSILNVFPWNEELSEGVNFEECCESFFIQPDLFLRLRPGYENSVKEKLGNEKIYFKEIDSNCLSLSNA
jgi:16S rRNA (cytosine967-C5)-methyltransferase